ncbi:modification methylase (cytosine-specific DNA methylase) [Halobacteriovorax marinus SJ]|uniref:DNA (cytosine-5-)-methyltransferase n=1 Tax=Halobacteriovorax marinus (strain ATCC BAA-682 / DSM 15412 / SJ) TaxID=862908 RepID=E1X2G8_HALMS|nr:DNA cytosine methyltransferase [Halobacteriovorax marinus]CBW26735.1 modification methylase (cytosine-specific DNA methylase) [Halobacteriovorax marinus SJ]
MTKNVLNFIDIFAGAGGLSCGLELAGMKCVLGIDANKHAMETFARNHKHAQTYCGDITKLTKKELLKKLDGNHVHVVVGGPPCQGFSTVGLGNPDDMRNTLFLEFCRIVKTTMPYFVVIENVTGLLAKKNEKTLQNIFKKFRSLGYEMDVQVMSSQNYGVPEKRRRTILIGSRVNCDIVFPKHTHDTVMAKTFRPPMTVGDALENLETKKGKLYNHDLEQAMIKSKIDLKRLKRIPEGKGIRYQADEKKYLTPSLKLGVDWENLRENRFRQTKYQRLDRSLPSPTIMTHRHSYYHPVEHRYLTQREAAALQSFPNDFEFMGPLSAQWRQIGNAVPPLMAKAIGKSLKSMYKSYLQNQDTKTSQKSNHRDKIRNVREKAFVYKK